MRQRHLAAPIALATVALLISATATTGSAQAGVRTAASSATAGPTSARTTSWVRTWEGAVQQASPGSVGEAGFSNQTLRLRVHVSAGGAAIRLRVTNAYGTAPLTVGRVSVARPAGADGAALAAGSLVGVTFAGHRSVTVPPGAELVSDPVHFALTTDSDLSVSLYLPTATGPASGHGLGWSTSQVSTAGDHTGESAATAFGTDISSWYFLSGVDVAGTRSGPAGAIVTLGDSITDGYQSTYGADHRYPDYLADRIAARSSGPRPAVANAGITGNRILLDSPSFGVNALARLDRDVLTVPGARAVVIQLGINDIQQDPHVTDPQAIIDGLRQIAVRAHDAGLEVIGGTISPFEGWNPWSAQLDATRVAVNKWIRSTPDFDQVADFDRALRDPSHPSQLLPAYDCGDHLHPNDAGYQVMASTVPLPRH